MTACQSFLNDGTSTVAPGWEMDPSEPHFVLCTSLAAETGWRLIHCLSAGVNLALHIHQMVSIVFFILLFIFSLKEYLKIKANLHFAKQFDIPPLTAVILVY